MIFTSIKRISQLEAKSSKKISKKVNSLILWSKAQEAGFTLIEILIAIFLGAVLLTVVMGGFGKSRDTLNENANRLEAALRYAHDEASLGATLTRLKLLMDSEPVEYLAQKGPSGSFVIPTSRVLQAGDNRELLSESEQEAYTKEQEELDSQFSSLSQFKQLRAPLDDEVRIIAVATTSDFITEGSPSLYFYPSGEKESALIFLAYDLEMMSIELKAFQDDYDRDYYPYDNADLSEEDLTQKQIEQAKEVYEQWLKK